jgi:hypothetical protein
MVAVIGAGCSNAPVETGNGSSTSTGSSGGTDAAIHEEALKFAECMRDNGVEEFPDPDAEGGLTVDAIANGSSVDMSGPAWEKAIGACEELQPPGFTGDTRSADEQEAALEFAQCIRDNGVEDFPDPALGDPLVDTNRIPSAAEDGGMAILNAAMGACGDVAAAAGATGPEAEGQ